MTAVIGVDLSLAATGIATDRGEHVARTSPTLPIGERLLSIRQALDAVLIRLHGPVLFVIEDLPPSTRGNSVNKLAMVHGVVHLWLHLCTNVHAAWVNPSAVKKYATGSGASSVRKGDVRMAVYKRFGLDIADDNACDAFVLRAMGLDWLGEPLAQVPTANRLALKKVSWPQVVGP